MSSTPGGSSPGASESERRKERKSRSGAATSSASSAMIPIHSGRAMTMMSASDPAIYSFTFILSIHNLPLKIPPKMQQQSATKLRTVFLLQLVLYFVCTLVEPSGILTNRTMLAHLCATGYIDLRGRVATSFYPRMKAGELDHKVQSNRFKSSASAMLKQVWATTHFLLR
jgi:hypothetical protein